MMSLIDILRWGTFCGTLLITLTFITYATRIYWFALVLIRKKNKASSRSLTASLSRRPFISIMIPTYNEPNVVDRILRACTSLDYKPYEVVVVDDSDDGITTRILARWARHPRVKVIHRNHRKGWKGGALNEGLKHLDPRSEFVLVLDADFVPPRDVIQRLLAGFTDERVGAVQGYQWHVLNADENWVTRGMRTLTAATYAFDFVARDLCGGFNQLGGSVMMIRRDVLERVGGFGTSITEDWELTLKLYEHGYRVVYDGSVKVPCECPSTLRRFIKQQCRWAEGHTRNFKRYIWRILKCEGLPLKTKLDFLMVGAIFLQSVVFLTGQGLILLELLTGLIWQPLIPFPISLSLFFYVSIAYPLSMFLGLLNEGALRESYIIGALVLSYLIAPFLAWASIKGLVFNKGRFDRTYKTGKITRKLPGILA